jgi:RNA polymerase sigma-70 factor, ECF subfamily
MVATSTARVPTARANPLEGQIAVVRGGTVEEVRRPGEGVGGQGEEVPGSHNGVSASATQVRAVGQEVHGRTSSSGSSGPSDSFSRFYRSEYRAVVALAYALTGRAAVAEELAQDAFLVTHRNWARVSAYDIPAAFVRRVAANMAVSFARRLAAEARALARLAARSPKWSAPLEPPDADFWRSVRSLPRRQAQVLALRYLEDLPDEEIARILGCSLATVRVHLHNGRLALAGRLGVATNGRSSA